MKFNFTTKAVEALKEIDHDEGFFQRSLIRARLSQAVIKASELERVGQINKTMNNVDLEKGTFEIESIIVAKDIKTAVK